MQVGYIIMILWLLQLNDIFGLLFGKKFGKTHPFKTISPNKSIEGYLFGGVGIAMGIFLLHTYIPVLTAWMPYRALILFALFFVMGNTGDLLFSSLKRKLGIKDFSNILPGHGGVLDRFDNILFVAPTVYFLVWLGVLNI
ncbi:MAG: phosphatidate cytidylyltransferase, partial [Candidatus Latescibacteria bacterium]|nr:phosphatidate cytidylyltransferase [Candidatus Latescibacterota bacterium]